MNTPVKATYYDGVTSRPQEATVCVRGPNTLEVELEHGDRFHWPLEHKGMAWEQTTDALRLSFGEHPRKVLIIRDALFIKSFSLRMRFTGRSSTYERALALARSGPLLFFIGVIALLVCSYLWVLPWGAERLALLAPRSLDEKLGDAAFAQMELGLAIDTARSAHLQAFGDELMLSSDHDLRYHVVREDEVNAFALPGGHIVVFNGIIDRMHTPGELAALLAHEATHVQERHSTRVLVRGLASYLFLSLLIGDASALAAVVAENVDKLRNMSYGRGLESEADAVGQQRMKENGVDPQGMVQLLELLEKEATDMPGVMVYLSSHPLTKERIEQAKKQVTVLGPANRSPAPLDSLFNALRAEE
jgi:beta-barrel assembly-enhancing protease